MLEAGTLRWTDEMRGARMVPMQHVGQADAPGQERFEAVVPLPFAGLTVWVRNMMLNTDRYVSTVSPLWSTP